MIGANPALGRGAAPRCSSFLSQSACWWPPNMQAATGAALEERRPVGEYLQIFRARIPQQSYCVRTPRWSASQRDCQRRSAVNPPGVIASAACAAT